MKVKRGQVWRDPGGGRFKVTRILRDSGQVRVSYIMPSAPTFAQRMEASQYPRLWHIDWFNCEDLVLET